MGRFAASLSFSREMQLALGGLVLGLVFGLCAGCTKSDALYCDESTPCLDPQRSFCDLNGSFPASSGVGRTCIADPNQVGNDGGPLTPDAAMDCSSSLSCSSAAPICEEGMCTVCNMDEEGDAECLARDGETPFCGQSGQCVECTDDIQCVSTNFPICGETGDCQACSKNDECESGACNFETGACTLLAAIIYVDPVNGVDASACGSGLSTSACKTISGASGAQAKLSPTRKTIVLAPGNYIETVGMTGVDARIVGHGARLFPPSFEVGPAFRVEGNSKLALYDMTLRSGNSLIEGFGLSCKDSDVQLESVQLVENDSAGLLSDNCKIDIADSRIALNSRQGLKVEAGSELRINGTEIKDNSFQGFLVESSVLELKRSTVLANAAGGLTLEESSFILENNIIARNGSSVVNPSKPAGGIVIENSSGFVPQIIRHNTIVDNNAPVVLGAAGVVCNSGTTAVSCDSNIVVGNSHPVVGSQFSGSCNFRYSMVSDIASGQGNISATPIFTSPAMGDYHLGVNSPGIDLADPSSIATVDIDNEPRPQGSGFDMGADERP